MKNLANINVSDVFIYLQKLFNKTTKKQIIVCVLLLILICFSYIYSKNWLLKNNLYKEAQKIITTISQEEQKHFKNSGKYKQDIFKDKNLATILSIRLNNASEYSNKNDKKFYRRAKKLFTKEEVSYDVGYSNNFYIEIDSENACLILKHKKNTKQQTVFFASFENAQPLCQGKNCLKTQINEDLCYIDGNCFKAKQDKETERICGDGHGKQTRECIASCEYGTCKEWSECWCDKGFEWDGTTCKQLQTEKDCTESQCYNGIYCEDKKPIEKEIENGLCKRSATCQKNKGWSYANWDCSCINNNFCPYKEQCYPYPEEKKQISLANNEGSCTDTYYVCDKNLGWKEKAHNCVCEKIGTFWDPKMMDAKCSPCTNKPLNAVFTSAAKNKDNCEWNCKNGYQKRDGNCLKPNGQYLCVQTSLDICTDDFSKKRKMKQSKDTNETQLCFVEDKDNILFYNKKEKTCKLCQCVDLVS